MNDLIVMSRDDLRSLIKECLDEHKEGENHYLNTEEAAKYLGLHPVTIRRKANAGILKSHRMPGSTRFVFKKTELNDYIDES